MVEVSWVAEGHPRRGTLPAWIFQDQCRLDEERGCGMAALAEDIVNRLAARGFQRVYDTAAVHILTHPAQPGLEVRVGTVYVVIERDGREIYRAPLARFDLMQALRRIDRP